MWFWLSGAVAACRSHKCPGDQNLQLIRNGSNTKLSELKPGVKRRDRAPCQDHKSGPFGLVNSQFDIGKTQINTKPMPLSQCIWGRHNINHLFKVSRYSKATIFQDNNILKKSSNYLEGFGRHLSNVTLFPTWRVRKKYQK